MALKKKNYDLNNMMGLDLFLFSGDRKVGNLPKSPVRKTHPLMAWDVIGLALLRAELDRSREADLKYLRKLAVKCGWTIDLELLLAEDYEALVLTDAGQKILWVNAGFTAMTGYASGKVTGKFPNMLQGSATSEATRMRIRKKLADKCGFTETLVNYRKDQTPYDCRVKVIPLSNAAGQVTHFIALESED